MGNCQGGAIGTMLLKYYYMERALDNLSFCNEYSEIIILKSASYRPESIDMFNKIINSRKLKIKIIDDLVIFRGRNHLHWRDKKFIKIS